MAETKTLEPIFSEYADDADMRELIELFIGELPKRVALLEKAVQAGDVMEIARVAHQLKGAAGGYGYSTITDAAAVVEKSAKAKSSIDALTAEIQAIADLCTRALAGFTGVNRA